jgi:tetratricopeptide (TPR) repeat protein
MGASLLIFLGLLIATLIYRFDRSRRDRELELETADSRLQYERSAQEANQAYHRRRLAQTQTEARTALERAREALAWIDDRIAKDPTDPTLHDRAVEATIALNQFLESFPDDAPALSLRARSWEFRRNYDFALRDLERALVLQPTLEPEVRKRLELLRKLNTKPALK